LGNWPEPAINYLISKLPNYQITTSKDWFIEFIGNTFVEDEVRLVKQAQAGDEAAFVALYHQNQPSVYTYIYYRVGEQMTAEDLTAEVFVRLVSKIHKFKPGKRPILAWLYTIAGNLVTDHYRRNGRSTIVPLNETVRSNGHSPGHIIEKSLDHQRLVAAMAHLTEEQRQVVLLKFVERRSNLETAAILGKTEGAVKALQHRALAALRRVLEEDKHYEHV
jgi:RNA polymerase sigma-70 factor (ECF subfamily)